MSRREFVVWLVCTLIAVEVLAWLFVACSAPRLAESVEVGVGHSAGTLDWSNSQRSADTQSNSVFVSVHPFAGIADEPRAPIWETQPPVDTPKIRVHRRYRAVLEIDLRPEAFFDRLARSLHRTSSPL